MKSRFVLGTVQFGLPYGVNNQEGKPDREKVFSMLEFAFDNGIQHLDTAEAYGDAQPRIGEFIRDTGKKFRINSKFHATGISIASQLEKTLHELSIPALDTYFYHRFEDLNAYPRLLSQLGSLQEQKLIKNIGVSVYSNEELQEALEIETVNVLQLPFNLLDNFSRRGALLRDAKRQNKITQVRSVFLQGLFFKPIADFPEKLRPLSGYIAELAGLASANGFSMYELALGYALSMSEIDEVVIGIDSQEQLAENLRISEKTLSKKLVDQINNITVQDSELLYPKNWQ